jgi:hypothetical protein
MTAKSAVIDDIERERLQSFADALTILCQQHRIAIPGKIATYPLVDAEDLPDADVNLLEYKVDADGYLYA